MGDYNQLRGKQMCFRTDYNSYIKGRIVAIFPDYIEISSIAGAGATRRIAKARILEVAEKMKPPLGFYFEE